LNALEETTQRGRREICHNNGDIRTTKKEILGERKWLEYVFENAGKQSEETAVEKQYMKIKDSQI